MNFPRSSSRAATFFVFHRLGHFLSNAMAENIILGPSVKVLQFIL